MFDIIELTNDNYKDYFPDVEPMDLTDFHIYFCSKMIPLKSRILDIKKRLDSFDSTISHLSDNDKFYVFRSQSDLIDERNSLLSEMYDLTFFPYEIYSKYFTSGSLDIYCFFKFWSLKILYRSYERF